jgi:hypothetical protein
MGFESAQGNSSSNSSWARIFLFDDAQPRTTTILCKENQARAFERLNERTIIRWRKTSIVSLCLESSNRRFRDP